MTKKKKVLIITVSILLIVAIAALSFATWIKTFTQKEINELDSGCFKVDYADTNAIKLENAYPMEDVDGLKTKGYKVTITNSCKTIVSYNVLYNVMYPSSLGENHVKVAVNDNAKLLTEYGNPIATTVVDSNSSRLIKTGIIPPNASEAITIKNWVDYNTTSAQGANKHFEAKISIDSSVADNKLLATKILTNNEIKAGNPDFKIGEPPAVATYGATGSGLYTAQDDQGASYYFRGDKSKLKNNIIFGEDNNENELHWKIVRINGDGSIRLILVSDFTSESHPLSIGSKYFNYYTYTSGTAQHEKVGFTTGNRTPCTKSNPCQVNFNPVETSSTYAFTNTHGGQNSTIKTHLEDWYYKNLKRYDSKVATGYFCNDTSYGSETDNGTTATLYYGAYKRIATNKTPSLKCPDPEDKKGTERNYGGIYKTKIGLLTADEMNMAGLSYNSPYATDSNYLYYSNYWWSLSPYNANTSAYVFVGSDGRLDYDYTNNAYAVVPVINLSADTLTITGDGSETSPFVIN